MDENSKKLKALIRTLKKDSESGDSKYPIQAYYALQDKGVEKALEKKFESHSLVDISDCEFNRSNGLIHLTFNFKSKKDISLENNALLVLMDYQMNVVGLVQDYDPVRPNPVVPAKVPIEGEVPFIAARPTQSGDMVFTEDELKDVEDRNQVIMQRGGIERREEGDEQSYCSEISVWQTDAGYTYVVTRFWGGKLVRKTVTDTTTIRYADDTIIITDPREI